MGEEVAVYEDGKKRGEWKISVVGGGGGSSDRDRGHS